MKKYLYSILLAGILSTSACTDQDTIEKNISSGAGSINFLVELPSAGSIEKTSDSHAERMDYPSDFQVDRINVYLFSAEGELLKTFNDVENQLSEETSTTNITLADVPAGNNQTLLCVVNPESFEQLSSLTATVRLEEMLAFSSKSVNPAHPDALMFMISQNSINVRSGMTTTVAGTLTRGVARLDIASIDKSIEVDSVRISGAASKGYLKKQVELTPERISFTQKIANFEEQSKVAYLNEVSVPADIEIYFTRNEVKGVAQLEIPAVNRNNIYSVNLEVANGTHLVTGTLTIAPWTTNVLEGSVASEVGFDPEATISSFRMEDGGQVSLANDTTLQVPGGKGAGLLCFIDGAEVSVNLLNPEDADKLEINRNAATRGSIKTSFDIKIKPYETTEPTDRREVKIRVTNLLSGKDNIFIISQQSAGYKEVHAPVLDFENSHQYVFGLSLEGIATAAELTVPTDDDFLVTVTKEASGKYQILLEKKRLFEMVPQNKRLILTHSGKKAVIINLAADRGFEYEEVQMGDLIFMDRDLGALEKQRPGEIFIPGSLIPLDQQGYGPGVANGYVGQGRKRANTISHNYADKWFQLADGRKNQAIDPCPKGWHVASYADYQKIFTSVINQTANPILNQGTLKASVAFDAAGENINVSLNNNTLTFNYSGGHYLRELKRNNEWPCGWWTSSKASNGRVQHLAFDIVSPYEVGLRVHDMTTQKVGLNIRCVKDAGSSPSTEPVIPTVVLGGKEWMAFNSMGYGNSVQLLCNQWENVEDLYKEHWTDYLGKLFQWGRKYPHNQWGSYQNNPGNEDNTYADWNSKPLQVPCPNGFRIPTKNELSDLLPSFSIPRQATYLYGSERVRAELINATPSTISGWHDYSGTARYLKITSVESGKYLILPLGGAKPDKSSSVSPFLGERFRLWAHGGEQNSERAIDLNYYPADRNVAVPLFDNARAKEAYDYVRCIKK